jgi:hypothetical protein
MTISEPKVKKLSLVGKTRAEVLTKDDARVGHDLLELLTQAMYVDPLTVYREYIQNAADAIDEAHRNGILSADETGRVDVYIDLTDRAVRIRDNGASIPRGLFIQRLLAIGLSSKRGKGLRGFRGIGRLAHRPVGGFRLLSGVSVSWTHRSTRARNRNHMERKDAERAPKL